MEPQDRSDKPEGWVPNWQAIENSEIWQNQIRPWLEAMRQDALEEKAPPLAGAESATLTSYHFWRGYVAALKDIRDMPVDMVEVNRKLLAQEKEDAFVREQQEQRRRRV